MMVMSLTIYQIINIIIVMTAIIKIIMTIIMTRYGGYHNHPAKKPRLYQEEEPRNQVS